MAAQFDFVCKNCGNSTFKATGWANDMMMLDVNALNEEPDRLKFSLTFTCDKCNTTVTEVLDKESGVIYEMNLTH